MADQRDVNEIIRRAATAAGAPVSIHEIVEGREGAHIAGSAECEACAYVASLPWGKQTCRKSREKWSTAAVRRGKTVPFLCHMGFSCVTTPAGNGGQPDFAVTVGPFCPVEDREPLREDARQGLLALRDAPSPELPFSLEDLPHADTEAMIAIAEWTADSVRDLCQPDDEPVPENEHEPEASAPNRSRPRSGRTTDAYHAAEIVAALMAGNSAQVRSLVESVLSENWSRKRLSLQVLRARTVAVTGAVLEAAERAGTNTNRTWEVFPLFLEAVSKAESIQALKSAVMKTILRLKHGAPPRDVSNDDLESQVMRLVQEYLVEGITLREVAERVGASPTQITHRLQRTLGLSYSDFVGRARVDLAKRLLRETELGIADVARRVGIDDTSNFGKLFRKHQGQSPTEYRNRFGRG